MDLTNPRTFDDFYDLYLLCCNAKEQSREKILQLLKVLEWNGDLFKHMRDNRGSGPEDWRKRSKDQ